MSDATTQPPKPDEEKKDTPVERRLTQVRDAVDKEKAKKFVAGFKGTI